MSDAPGSALREDAVKEPSASAGASRTAFRFVLMIGVVSFFADLTYEGARSELGPYLAMLGASGAVVGIVSGFGELLGYGLRLVSGRAADRSGLFWPITTGGYILQMGSVPLLAFTPHLAAGRDPHRARAGRQGEPATRRRDAMLGTCRAEGRRLRLGLRRARGDGSVRRAGRAASGRRRASMAPILPARLRRARPFRRS